MVTRDEMEHIVSAMTEQAVAWEASLREMFESQLSKMKEEMMLIVSSGIDSCVPTAHSPAPMQQSTKGSCIIGHPEGAEPCNFYTEDPERWLVAKGNVHNLGSTVHQQ